MKGSTGILPTGAAPQGACAHQPAEIIPQNASVPKISLLLTAQRLVPVLHTLGQLPYPNTRDGAHMNIWQPQRRKLQQKATERHPHNRMRQLLPNMSKYTLQAQASLIANEDFEFHVKASSYKAYAGTRGRQTYLKGCLPVPWRKHKPAHAPERCVRMLPQRVRPPDLVHPLHMETRTGCTGQHQPHPALPTQEPSNVALATRIAKPTPVQENRQLPPCKAISVISAHQR